MNKILLWSSVAIFALAPQLAFAESHEADLAAKLEMANKAAMAAEADAKPLKLMATITKVKAANAKKAAMMAAEGTDEDKIAVTKTLSMVADKNAMMAKEKAAEAADIEFMANNTVMDIKEMMAPIEEEASGEETMMVSMHEIVAGDNLWNLAKTTYGDATMWTKIQSANEGIKVKGLKIGGKLNIPK